MPKYKYVDGVKYRVVPQSVLGYALVREGSDNSLPSGGTEGQVLAKASDADYDVEWATVESGGGTFYIEGSINTEQSVTVTTTLEEVIVAIQSGKTVIAKLTGIHNNYAEVLFIPLTVTESHDPTAPDELDYIEFERTSFYQTGINQLNVHDYLLYYDDTGWNWSDNQYIISYTPAE